MGSAAVGAPSPCWARRKGPLQLRIEPCCLVGSKAICNEVICEKQKIKRPRSCTLPSNYYIIILRGLTAAACDIHTHSFFKLEWP